MELLNRTDCAAKIIDLGSRAATVQADIHVCAVSSIAHMRDHGDYRTALQLMNALPNGIRVQGLAIWYREFTNSKFSLSFDSKDKQWKGSLKKDRAEGDFRVDEASNVTFADFTKENAAKTMTLVDLLKRIKSFADNSELNKDGTPKVSSAAREGASKLLRAAADLKIIPEV